ncbi:substrate-binding domain-containing protein, partial [Brucella oryzae]
MMGVPTATNHAIRSEFHQKVFAENQKIKFVATGIYNDDIETAQKQAAAIMQANPNLKGWVASDAAGPSGIGPALKEAGKVGT